MTTPDPTLDSVIAGALAVLAGFLRASSAGTLAAFDNAIEAGAEPALVVTATRAGSPEMHVAARVEDRVVLLARVLTEAPTDKTLQ